MNWSSVTTNQSNQSTQVDPQDLIATYGKVELSSAILLVILSPITVFTNGLFLLALYQDSLKCFRKTPTTVFIAGLSLADFVTGLLVEPSFAVHYGLKYYNSSPDVLRVTGLIYIIGGTISTIAISTSFVIVLAMSLSQYIAIRYPHKYKTIVTTSRVVRLLGLSSLYFLGFSLLQFTGIGRKQFLLFDVVLHPTLISCLLIAVHILMRRAFQERVSKPARNRTLTTRSATRSQDKDTEIKTHLIDKPPSLPKFSPTSTRGQDNSTQESPLLSKEESTNSKRLSAQDRESCTIPPNAEHNNRRQCVVIELNVVERNTSREDSEGTTHDTTNQYDRSSTCDSFQQIESSSKIEKIKREHVTDVADQGNVLDVSNKDSEENADDENQEIPTKPRQQVHSLHLRRTRNSFYLKRKKAPIERQFAIMSFYLSAILLLSSISHTVVFYVFLLKTPENITEDVYVNIALRITDLMLFVKVFLDAFIYAWRLPAYRRSLILTISCGRIELANDV
jgi:hypothetical protein